MKKISRISVFVLVFVSLSSYVSNSKEVRASEPSVKSIKSNINHLSFSAEIVKLNSLCEEIIGLCTVSKKENLMEYFNWSKNFAHCVLTGNKKACSSLVVRGVKAFYAKVLESDLSYKHKQKMSELVKEFVHKFLVLADYAEAKRV